MMPSSRGPRPADWLRALHWWGFDDLDDLDNLAHIEPGRDDTAGLVDHGLGPVENEQLSAVLHGEIIREHVLDRVATAATRRRVA